VQSRPSRAEARRASLANQLLAENLVDFSDVARHFHVHVGTLHRWRHPGVRSVRLAAIRVGGRWRTTWEALDRFVSALNAGHPEGPAPVAPSDRRAGAIERELKAEGL
jgi:hypothetical protein